MRIVIVAALACGIGCHRYSSQWEGTCSAEPIPGEGSAAVVAAGAVSGEITGVLRWMEPRDRHGTADVLLEGDGVAPSTTVTDSTFRFAGVLPGRYVLRSKAIGRGARADTIVVPPQAGVQVIIPFSRGSRAGCQGPS